MKEGGHVGVRWLCAGVGCLCGSGTMACVVKLWIIQIENLVGLHWVS